MTPLPAWLPDWLAAPLQSASEQARAVLSIYDMNQAYDQVHAITDKSMALLTGYPERDIIDLSKELLQCKLLVLASDTQPAGRWIVRPHIEAGMKAARKYCERLDSRGVKILGRAKETRAAIAFYDAHARPADSRQQFALNFAAPPAAAPKWRDN